MATILGKKRYFFCSTRHLSLLFNRTNLFENLLHLIVVLKANREADRFAVEDDVNARFANATRRLHCINH